MTHQVKIKSDHFLINLVIFVTVVLLIKLAVGYYWLFFAICSAVGLLITSFYSVKIRLTRTNLHISYLTPFRSDLKCNLENIMEVGKCDKAIIVKDVYILKTDKTRIQIKPIGVDVEDLFANLKARGVKVP